MRNFFDIAFTPAVAALQERHGSAGRHDLTSAGPSELDADAISLITTRDSFYMATVGETGWPYVQHRGGDEGFVKVLGPTTIGWVERTGNRQYVGTGNITADDRVALIFVDYPHRMRLKMFGIASYHPEPDEELLAAIDGASVRSDGAVTIEVAATSWNCPKYITPRYTAAQVALAVAQYDARINELEAKLAEYEATQDPERS